MMFYKVSTTQSSYGKGRKGRKRRTDGRLLIELDHPSQGGGGAGGRTAGVTKYSRPETSSYGDRFPGFQNPREDTPRSEMCDGRHAPA